MNVGLTGGIATGKSTVSKMLVHRGAVLIDADVIAREVVLPGQPVLQKVAQRFGQVVLMEDGALNRTKLGEIIFNDPIARKDLEGILHPPIRSLMKQRMVQYEKEDPNRLVVVDIPLLFESNLQELFSSVVLVYVPEIIQVKRLMKRNDLSLEEAKKRMEAQMPIEIKKELTDYIIDNSKSLEHTETQVEEFWEEIYMK
ncbi:dephospho-CoA kinase [Chengkuizengella axinellae]|uniref:Dephospho-CoA kinase n=1 Tax=Chengkuizengella axinellae TaxID=3064388 RepID=A0ABT9IYL5_9BACL|nr:dephospho-CoA kinase [Chengkuizengella sp. 2205SS18-9]MDP5274448.1 dephospho-CoA kinase [Chengkuizengella sp. 2205SS18-9]